MTGGRFTREMYSFGRESVCPLPGAEYAGSDTSTAKTASSGVFNFSKKDFPTMILRSPFLKSGWVPSQLASVAAPGKVHQRIHLPIQFSG